MSRNSRKKHQKPGRDVPFPGQEEECSLQSLDICGRQISSISPRPIFVGTNVLTLFDPNSRASSFGVQSHHEVLDMNLTTILPLVDFAHLRDDSTSRPVLKGLLIFSHNRHL